MLNNLHNLILSKKNILIATGTRHNADVIFSSLALHLLLNSVNVDNHIFSLNIERSKIWKTRLSTFPSISVSGDIPINYTFSLPKDINIKDIKWKKDKGKYEINIKSTSPNIDVNLIELKQTKQKFDLLIFIGNKSQITYENTGLSEEEYNKIDKVLIFSKKTYLNGKAYDNEGINNNKCFCLKIIEIAKQFEFSINKDTATLILSGIINYTDGFKKNIKGDIFNNVQSLLNKEVDYQQAYHLAVGDLNIKKLLFLGNLFSRIKLIAPNIYQAGLISRSTIKMHIEVSEMMKISEIYDCVFGIISIGSPTTNRIYLYNRSKDIDLKALLTKLKGKGNNKQGIIETKEQIKDVLKLIHTHLGISSNNI